MNIAIFGATGRTGLQVVDRALRRGHDVTVLVRNPNKLGKNQARVKVLQGDIQDESMVSQAIAGTQAVISVLGPTENQPTFEISKETKNILGGMQQHGVQRLIISTGAGIGASQDSRKLFTPGPGSQQLTRLAPPVIKG